MNENCTKPALRDTLLIRNPKPRSFCDLGFDMTLFEPVTKFCQNFKFLSFGQSEK